MTERYLCSIRSFGNHQAFKEEIAALEKRLAAAKEAAKAADAEVRRADGCGYGHPSTDRHTPVQRTRQHVMVDDA